MLKLIEMISISKSYNKEQVIKPYDFTLYEDEIVIVKGPSGTGKTTFLSLICGIEKADTGEVYEHPMLYETSKVPLPLVFQENESLLPWKTVEQNVQLVNPNVNPTIIESVLQSVHLKGHEHKLPEMLSGGMKKRLCIAQALVCQSKVIIMDEPFGNLDLALRQEMERLILEIKQSHRLSFVIVTHDSLPILEQNGRVLHSTEWR